MSTGSRIQITDRLAQGPDLSYGGAVQGTAVAMPISYQGGLSTTVTSQVIPGGTLGNNGYLEVDVYGVWALSATGAITATMSGSATGLTNVATQNLTGGTSYSLGIKFLFQNVNSESANFVMAYADALRNAAAAQGPYRRSQSTTFDTSQDWTVVISLSTDTASSGTAEIQSFRLTSYFIP